MGVRSLGSDPHSYAIVAPPDTLLQIKSVDFGMACESNFARRINVKWRGLAALDHRVLAVTTTRCFETLARTVDAWRADSDCARAKVERALAKTGQRVAAELLAAGEPDPCSLSHGETGEIEP